MKIVVSAGGSGGHINPALSIIQKFKELEEDLEILYIGTTNRMEKDIIPKHNINYIGLDVQGLKRSLSFSNILTLFKFIKSIIKVKKVLKEFKPDFVIGVGGYVTAPVVYSAKKLKFKTFIHEQNKNFGLTNKFLLKYADKVFTSFETTTNIKYKDKIRYTGNPTSETYLNSTPAKKSDYNLDKNKKLVLMVLGSLGSQTVNKKMKVILKEFKNKDYEFIYVTGKDYYKDFKNIKNVKVLSYVDDMAGLLKITDLIITRAGAATISEIAALKVPAIIIPSMYVTDNHQYENALELVDKKCALLLEEKNLNKENLINKIEYILNSKEKYNEFKENISKLTVENSATKIYTYIVEKV